MPRRRLLPLVALIVSAMGCATGSFIEETGGAGGQSTSSNTSGSTTSSASTSTATTGATTTSGSSSSASTTGSSTSSSSVASSSSSGLMCDADEHVCSGACAGNTIQTGCFGSASCAPCPAPPLLGTETCNANGQCDFTCPAGYNKVGSACACATQCCTQNDCGANQSCNGGMCVDLCDSTDCQNQCLAICVIQGKLGIGQCNGGNCNCVCI